MPENTGRLQAQLRAASGRSPAARRVGPQLQGPQGRRRLRGGGGGAGEGHADPERAGRGRVLPTGPHRNAKPGARSRGGVVSVVPG